MGGVGRAKNARTTSNPTQNSEKGPTIFVDQRGGQDETRRNTPNPDPQNAENVTNKPIRKPPDPQNPEKRKNIERSGDAKISHPRRRFEINLRYVRPPVQTR